MATKELLTQLKLRKDTAANWTDKNPILGNGEMVIIETSSGEQRFKVGDGEKTFTQLPYTDENLLSKIKSYTAGDGISISNEGVISSTSGSSDDVFVVEFGDDGTTITTSFDDIKNAIQNHRILIYSNDGNATLPLLGSYNGDATTDQDEAIYLGGYEQNVYVEWLLLRA